MGCWCKGESHTKGAPHLAIGCITYWVFGSIVHEIALLRVHTPSLNQTHCCSPLHMHLVHATKATSTEKGQMMTEPGKDCAHVQGRHAQGRRTETPELEVKLVWLASILALCLK